VTPTLLVGGDLDTRDESHARQQLHELVDAGVTHLVDTRLEWSDQEWVAAESPGTAYLHVGMDDAGQAVPDAWFDDAVGWVQEARADGGVVLAHCHMGVNRGPSLGFAVLLAEGWDPLEALVRIRQVRPIAWVAYAEDALGWHHRRQGTDPAEDLQRVADWRAASSLDLERVIREKRAQGW
jgi:dual specificity phosphatase 3